MDDNFFKNLFKKTKYLESEIEDYVVIQESVIVLLKIFSKVAVIALDLNGSLLWKMKNKNYFGKKNCYYSGIWVLDGKLFIYSTSGVELTVNPKTGEISNEDLIR